ncbi:hypothetical protein C5O78_13445 [Treponema phagedenis]|nr:hypothetical protein C5O78_13445 [Treponema phagedenis]
MFYSVSFIVDTFSNVNLITKRYPRYGYTKSIKLLFDVSMPQGFTLEEKRFAADIICFSVGIILLLADDKGTRCF